MRLVDLTLLLSLITGSVAAADPASIQFDRSQVSIAADDQFVRYGDLALIPVGDGLSLPVADLLVRLTAGDSAQLSRATITNTSLKAIAPQRVRRTPTSADGRYGETWTAGSDAKRLGQRVVEHWGVTWIEGVRYERILVFPVTFDISGELAFHSQVFLELGAESVSPADICGTAELLWQTTPDARPEAVPAAFDGVIDYTIVSADRFLPALQRLAAFRRQTGYSVEMIAIEEIAGAYAGVDPAEQLRAYLQDFHMRGGRFVLLAGDETVVPNRLVYQYNITGQPAVDLLQPSDLYFADLTGDWDTDGDGVWGERTNDSPDLIEELFVGRLPLADSAQFEKYTDNLITYETDPGHGDLAWLTRSLFYSSDQMRDYLGGGQHATLAASLPGGFSVDTLLAVEQASGADPAPNNAAASQIDNATTDAYGMVNIIAHGRSDGFVVRSSGYNDWPKSYLLIAEESGEHGCFDSLFFDGKPSFYVSLACDNGGYDLGPAGAERRSVVQTLLGERDGAVGFVGNTRWGWVSSSYLLHKAFLDSLAAHPEQPAIRAMYRARKAYPYYRDLVYGLNYFGDPALRVYTNRPARIDLLVSGGADQPSMTLSSLGDPLADVRVVITNLDHEVVLDGLTDGDGAFPLDGLPDDQLYTLTVSEAGYVTLQAELGPSIITDIDDEPMSLPDRFALDQNYPNPFNPATVITYQLPVSAFVRLSVVNILGQEVASLVKQKQAAGEHAVTWEAGDRASGVYFYRLEAGEFTAVRKMLLVR